MRDVKYRGTSRKIRLAVANGDVSGELTDRKLIGICPEVPVEVLRKSALYLANNGELTQVDGRIYAQRKAEIKRTTEGREVCVLGNLKGADIDSETGKMLVTVLVSNIDYR